MENCYIFFSWASEFPENKKFILEILEESKEILKKEKINLIILESTSDLPGFVDINNAIYNRIESCDFFVCDLSIIGGVGDKLIINPNVTFELGTMIGKHGFDRIFAFYNEKTISNPSLDLPFDFSHNRTIRFKINKDKECRKLKIKKLSSIIVETIVLFRNSGNLFSAHPLKEHDIQLNKSITESMEKFKQLVCGDFEKLEIYNGTDVKNNLPGDYDFLYDFIHFLEQSINKFADYSLESTRKLLLEKINSFLWMQSISTHEYFSSNAKCTKRYFVENHPFYCKDYNLPVITNGDYDCPEMSLINKEADDYRKAAKDIVDVYEKLEMRIVSLSK